ncbi:hypothetical protein [Arthrobacter alpinus]|uniref:hypothetical protein n=1 Tax=Arthrobacter alpinus TaxID=656366 RepID=UPI000B24F033|nr:hypothetical protein [Arthrobacter alpinus]
MDPDGNRELIKDMNKGDVVFNYFGPYVRAVSVVTENGGTAREPGPFNAAGKPQ